MGAPRDVVDVVVGEIAVAAFGIRRRAVEEEVDLEARAVVMVDGGPDRLHPVAVAEERRDIADAQLVSRPRPAPGAAGDPGDLAAFPAQRLRALSTAALSAGGRTGNDAGDGRERLAPQAATGRPRRRSR